MSETLDARKFIVDFLRKELVGPSPGFPLVQLDGQEILRAQDPPRQRYSAGVLFPMKAQVLRQDETGADEEASHDADTPEPDQLVEGSKTKGSLKETKTGTGEVPPDTDQDVTLANEFLPSAMGLSALLEVPEILRVNVQAGIYRHEEPQWDIRTDKDRGRMYTKGWWRRPIERALELSSNKLLGDGNVTLKKTVFEEGGKIALELHVVSRPHEQSDKSGRLRLITFTLINRRQSESKTPGNSDCFFQCGFSVREPNGKPCFRTYPELNYGDEDSEELSLRLLYRYRHVFAVGHGCAPEWEGESKGRAFLIRTEVLPKYEMNPVLPTKIEGLDLRMNDLMADDTSASTALCGKLADKYEEWIAAREREIDSSSDLPSELKKTGHRHIKDCRKCLRRMRDGIALLAKDPDSALAFRLMNKAMLMQSAHYKISTDKPRKWEEKGGKFQLEKPFVRPLYTDSKQDRSWRPFQLAFILMNLRAVAEPDCPERGIVDVIWFPTGGGKTEAYLGLSAFNMFLRRLRNPDHAGTCVLMRYTLRLLTTQQFKRAASLICACEFIRRKEEIRLGSERFSVGLWVGGEVTPNSEKDAVKALQELNKSERSANKFILLSCPWCGAAMGPQQIGNTMRCKGYGKLPRSNRVRHICEDPDCDFSSDDGLPLAVIDEQIYRSPPTLLIGTVDKFAMLAFWPKARHLFGVDTPYPPPELIVQDELHLISGPLGSMVGHYETVVNALCINEEGNPAKIVASTATIARAIDQVKALYGRDTFLFPPQALTAGDSFFAEENEDEVGRLYVGVFASALTSHVTTQVQTMSALLQAPKLFSLGTPNPKAIDPYWTLMGYFNSLRELGHAATLIQADIREYINAMCSRLGQNHGISEDAPVDLRRFIRRNEELTSRIQSSKIPAILDRLFKIHDGSGKSEVVDICFATNMIQVGLDIPRLGLMTIIGQPKTTAEYVQASSRIGRTSERPGIVVTNYNPSKPRDRSHYEHFRSYHQAIYRYVEPTSVTPYATPVCERALHALIVILYRFWGAGDGLHDSPGNPLDHPELVERIKKTIRERVNAVDCGEWPKTNNLIDNIFYKWSKLAPLDYGGFGSISEEIPLMHPAGKPQHPEWDEQALATPSSMRNVDADCSARQLKRGYSDEFYGS